MTIGISQTKTLQTPGNYPAGWCTQMIEILEICSVSELSDNSGIECSDLFTADIDASLDLNTNFRSGPQVRWPAGPAFLTL